MNSENQDETRLQFGHDGKEGRFWSPAADQHQEKLYELEDRLDAGTIAYPTVIEALDEMLGQTPEWIDGLTLRGDMYEQIGRPEKAEADYKHAYGLGTGAMPEDFKGRVIWLELDNRPFLRAASAYAHLQVQQERYKEAIQVLRRILKWNPNDNQGIRYSLGPALLRAGRMRQAETALRKCAEENPAMRYELGLVQIQRKAWIEAATTLRHAGIENPYIAQMLCGMAEPAPMALWLGSNLNDHSGARDYVTQWGTHWKDEAEARDFLWWLHTHPKVMRERAEALEPVEELLWEHDPAERGPIIERGNSRQARIDDALSTAIVRQRNDGRNGTGYPWRVLRKRRERDDAMFG